VDKELQKEVFSRLDALADKLGVVSGHLWEVLVRQAYVEAISSCVFFVLAVIAIFGIYRYGVLTFAKIKSNEWDDFAIVPFTVIGVLVGLFSGIAIVTCVGTIITGFANPEYAALNSVLKALGK
jgi:H+/Cl- antiporter ClcA